MDNILDTRLKLLSEYFDRDDIAVVGGMGVYLATGSYRDTDDMDLIQLKPNIGRKKQLYSLNARIKVDLTQMDSIFDSFNLSMLSDSEFEESICTKLYDSGEEILYLGREGLLASKMTSLCVSGDPNQMTEYGFKILRDRDIIDIKNLRNGDLNKTLLYSMLQTIPHLDEIDVKTFSSYFERALDDPKSSISFKKNAYGVGKVLAHPNAEGNISYGMLIEDCEYKQVPSFTKELDDIFHNLWSK